MKTPQAFESLEKRERALHNELGGPGFVVTQAVLWTSPNPRSHRRVVARTLAMRRGFMGLDAGRRPARDPGWWPLRQLENCSMGAEEGMMQALGQVDAIIAETPTT